MRCASPLSCLTRDFALHRSFSQHNYERTQNMYAGAPNEAGPMYFTNVSLFEARCTGWLPRAALRRWLTALSFRVFLSPRRVPEAIARASRTTTCSLLPSGLPTAVWSLA